MRPKILITEIKLPKNLSEVENYEIVIFQDLWFEFMGYVGIHGIVETSVPNWLFFSFSQSPIIGEVSFCWLACVRKTP